MCPASHQYIALRKSSPLHIKQNNHVTNYKSGPCWERSIKFCYIGVVSYEANIAQ